MKAVVVHGKDDLRVEEVPDPTCGPKDVLVRMEWGGICGSDITYWKKGISGTAVLREPLILGHEVAGRIVEIGDDVDRRKHNLHVDDAVTVHPATLVGDHKMPRAIADRLNLWPEVRYFGSAAFLPHEQGGFSEYRVVRADQIRALPSNVRTKSGALAEPLGVALHAVNRAGDVDGRSVLVNGAGPIGALCAAAAHAAGAARVTVSDVADVPLQIATKMGADEVVNVAAGGELPTDVDVAFEASGVAATLGAVIAATRRGGTLVQVGNLPGGDVSATLGNIVTREIEYRGSYRFVDEITDAVAQMARGLDVNPLMTHEFELADAAEAFAVAADRSTGSSKVMLKLS